MRQAISELRIHPFLIALTVQCSVTGLAVAQVPSELGPPATCTGYAVEEVDPVAMGWAADGYPVDELDTYRVFATFPCAVNVTSVGDVDYLFTVTSTDGQLFNVMTQETETTPSRHLNRPATAEELADEPALQWDTFLTIGTEEDPGDPDFAPGADVYDLDLTTDFQLRNTGWFVHHGVDGRHLLIAQFTVNEGVQITGTNWRITYADDYPPGDWYEEPLADWSTDPPIPPCPFPVPPEHQCPPSSWSLDRIDQRHLPLDNVYDPCGTGDGVSIYMLGTGINTTHFDFAGQATLFWDYEAPANPIGDCNGFGTHLASIAGGPFGVATAAQLESVRIMSCLGVAQTPDYLAGLRHVRDHGTTPGVVLLPNLPTDPDITDTVRDLIRAGFTVIAPIGNEDVEVVCDPASAGAAIPEVIVVAATDSADRRAGFSSYGEYVDVFAPGVSVEGAWSGSNVAMRTRSGTGQAAAHVAGVAAIYLGEHPASTPAEVHAAIVGRATAGVVSNPGASTANRLLYACPTPVPVDRCRAAGTWGLDRIDQRTPDLDGTFCWANERSCNSDGSGTHIYVMGTGINFDHVDFDCRASSFYEHPDLPVSTGGQDCEGTGTHTASLAAGATLGAAPLAEVHSVRVIGCLGSGSQQTVTDGLTAILQNGAPPPVVVILPGPTCDVDTNNAIQDLIDAGYVVIVPAGSEQTNICDPTCTPMAVPDAIVVGATTSSDCRVGFSNYGACVDLFAPGASVTGAWYTSSTATRTISGTAAAAGYAAGAAARILGDCPSLSPAEVQAEMIARATTLAGCAGDPMSLVFAGEFVAGDLDGSGYVGFADLVIVLSNWGPCAWPCAADLNNDGIVGFADVTTILNAWTSGP